MSETFFWIANFSLETWTISLRQRIHELGAGGKKTRVISYASQLDTAAQPQSGPARRPCQKITMGFLGVRITVVRVQAKNISGTPDFFCTLRREALPSTFTMWGLIERRLVSTCFESRVFVLGFQSVVAPDSRCSHTLYV